MYPGSRSAGVPPDETVFEFLHGEADGEGSRLLRRRKACTASKCFAVQGPGPGKTGMLETLMDLAYHRHMLRAFVAETMLLCVSKSL